MTRKTNQLLSTLSEFVSENKQSKIKSVLENRTNHITIVLEDIFQPHNASATIRTCDCLGVQNVHIIENRNEFRPSSQVMQGAGKWITLHRYNDNIQKDANGNNPSAFPNHNTTTCLEELKKQGFQLIATTPNPPPSSSLHSQRAKNSRNERSEDLSSLDLSKPTAFLFGTEAHGLTQKALEMADGYLALPMVGFTQSYNISVSVAITLSHSIKQLHDSKIAWHLNKQEKAELTLEWYKKCTKNADQILNKFDQ